jgi:hypothetical protein
MTNLALVKHDPKASNTGMNIEVAVSPSYQALKKYCKKTYNVDVVEEYDGTPNVYYTISDSDVIIVRENY